MNSPGALDDDMPAEIDCSGGERGKFYRPSASLNLPVRHGGNEDQHAPAGTPEAGEEGK